MPVQSSAPFSRLIRLPNYDRATNELDVTLYWILLNFDYGIAVGFIRKMVYPLVGFSAFANRDLTPHSACHFDLANLPSGISTGNFDLVVPSVGGDRLASLSCRPIQPDLATGST